MDMLIYLLGVLVALIPCLGNEQLPIDPKLLAAIRKVESNNNVCAIGDNHFSNKAYGVYQIRKPYYDDAIAFNPRLSRGHFPNNVYGIGSEEFSTKVVESFMCRYATVARLGHRPTNEDIARIHNGGPNGYKHGSTLGYWEKIRHAYDTISRREERDVTNCPFMCNDNECCGSTGCNCLNSSGMLMPCSLLPRCSKLCCLINCVSGMNINFCTKKF